MAGILTRMDNARKALFETKEVHTPNPSQEGMKAELLNELRKEALFGGGFGGNGSYMSYPVFFNGEKNLGEMGPVINYLLDHQALRARSWQAYLESEIALTILRKFTLWIISGGLKLQANPNKLVLNSEKMDIDREAFNEITEARFNVWAQSALSDYNNMQNLDKIAERAHRDAMIGGDVLVICRVVKGVLNVQLIDGCWVIDPLGVSSGIMGVYMQWGWQMDNGNTIRNGIEMNANGEHVAYYVRNLEKTANTEFNYTRIDATSKSTGLRMAWMLYGAEFRMDNNRGLPVIGACLESLKKVERYKEATVGSAEERAKIVYFIKHGQTSTGDSPLTVRAMHARGHNYQDDIPVDAVTGKQLATQVTMSTNKQTFNMPVDSELVSLESKTELTFAEFYKTNNDIICSAVGIPPDVALSIYNNSFSASRAATKDWEHTMDVCRQDFNRQFYQRIYDIWLHLEILKNKISVPGYLIAFAKDNYMALAAVRSADFTGAKFPHIDPVKEVTAERLKLGTLGAHMPLTTVEASTDALMEGDSTSNIEQFSKELEEAATLNIKPPAPPSPVKTDPPKEET